MNHRRSTVLFFAVVAAAACGSSKATSNGPGGDGGLATGLVTTDAEAEPDTGSTEPDAVAQSSSSGGDSSSPSDAQAPGDVTLPTDAQFLGDAAGVTRTFTVVNQCAQTIWADALPTTTFPGTFVEMPPGYSFEVGVASGWSGRIWGKTGCTTSGTKLTCASDSIPASLAELTLTTNPTGLDFYDVSLVDGFNLPIEIIAEGHVPDPAQPYDCGDPSCAVNLDATCPQPLQDIVGGTVLACANDECKVLGGNDAASPDCIYPNEYTRFFKDACPTAYSYPYDDPTSTFTCKGTTNSYAVVFCP
jgi:hypothetical protein